MPIDLATALGAKLPATEFSWSPPDVVLYHLALGAGADPTDQRELRYATDDDLVVLPTFAVVAMTLRSTQPTRFSHPGIVIDLANALHGAHRVEIHRPLSTGGFARSTDRVSNVYDKGHAAIIETTTSVVDADGVPLWESVTTSFVRGEGGFGGERGPSVSSAPAEREPDAVLVTPTLPQQALLYRLLGDRNPLHSRPSFAAQAGYPRPILQGLCTYGMVCKAVVDAQLDADVTRVGAFAARFTGVVFPGETLRTSLWRENGRIAFLTTVDERDDAPALSGGELVLVS